MRRISGDGGTGVDALSMHVASGDFRWRGGGGR